MSNIDKTIIPTVEYADVSVQRNIQAGGNITAQGNAIISHNLTVKGWLEANNLKGVNKGLFSDLSHLENAYPFPEIGWFAGVSATAEEITALGLPSVEGQSYFVMYICEADIWEKEPSGKLYRIEVDIAQVNELEDNVNQLRINVDACSSATNQNKEQIKSLQTQVSENANQIESNKQGVEQAKADAADAKQTANALGQEVQTLKTRADSHDTSINNVSFRVEANSNKITNLGTKINEAQTKIATNQFEISTLNTKVSSKADLSNSEQSISAKKVLVTGGYVIANQGEEATISYDGGVQDGNSFLKFTDLQNGGLIKLAFDGTEDTIVTKNQFDGRINTISSRVDTIEQDMDYVNEDIPNLKLRCDNLEEDAKIVLASMGTAVDNEGNNSEVAIGYVPSVGDRYYESSTGHIKYVKSSTVTEDLGLPSADRIYCNGMTKRLYVFKNGWKKVDKTDIVQSTGTSTTAVMSQKAITHELDTLDSNISNIKGELHGTTSYNITVTFNSVYEYQTIDKITAGTKIKNNTNNGYALYDKTEGTQVGSLIANSSVILEADITSIRIMGALPETPFNAEFTIGETKEGFIEKTNKNDATQNAELEVLNKDIYEVIYNKSLRSFEFYGSETEPLSHIIRKGSVVKNNSVGVIAIYNNDKSISLTILPQEIITTDFDIYFLRNWDTSQTINVSVVSALDSSLFRENAIKKLVLGYRINLNLTEFQYYPNPGKASNILVNKDVNVKNNGTYAVTLHDRKDSQNVKIEPGKRVRVPFDVYYIRNYADITANVSLEIEGLPSVEERVKVLEEKPSSSIDSVVVNVSDSTGIPSGSALLDNGVLALQLNNIKGERGNDGAQGVQGNSGVASSDGIESIQDLSQDIPNDTIERVYVAGAKVVKDKIEHLYRDKAPYSQFYGNGNTAKNINGGSGKNVIIGDDNAMYANNESFANTLIGYHADYGLTTGHSNTAIGCEALDRNRSGHDNVAVGMFAVGCNNLNGEDPTTYKSCTYNVGVGAYALHHNGGACNTAIGNFSSQSLDDDDTNNSNGNTAVGNYSLAYNKQGSYNVCIGNAAGKYSQGSLELYIDAIDRGDDSRNNPENITKGRTKSLVYGKFNGSPSSQEFHINAGLIVMPYLPSNDPHVSGALWNDGGTLKISNG